MTRFDLVDSLAGYQSKYAEEQIFVPKFLILLNHPNCVLRDHLPGHITASAWIVDHSKRCVLLTHHAKLNRWLQPGGHADGDEDTTAVAAREVWEETGLKLKPSLEIFDIDIHTIPARPDMVQHDHYDVRYLFDADSNRPLRKNHESHELRWVPLAELETITHGNTSIMRMAEKIMEAL